MVLTRSEFAKYLDFVLNVFFASVTQSTILTRTVLLVHRTLSHLDYFLFTKLYLLSLRHHYATAVEQRRRRTEYSMRLTLISRRPIPTYRYSRLQTGFLVHQTPRPLKAKLWSLWSWLSLLMNATRSLGARVVTSCLSNC